MSMVAVLVAWLLTETPPLACTRNLNDQAMIGRSAVRASPANEGGKRRARAAPRTDGVQPDHVKRMVPCEPRQSRSRARLLPTPPSHCHGEIGRHLPRIG